MCLFIVGESMVSLYKTSDFQERLDISNTSGSWKGGTSVMAFRQSLVSKLHLCVVGELISVSRIQKDESEVEAAESCSSWPKFWVC